MRNAIMRNAKLRNAGQRKGAIFLLLLVMLPVLILFVGFAVDLSHVHRVRVELRSTTDLAAKTAASVLSKTQDKKVARDAAIEIAGLNLVGGIPLTLKKEHFVFGNSSRQPNGKYIFTADLLPFNSVQVTGGRMNDSTDGAISSYFGMMYGHEHYQAEFIAIAGFVDLDICLVLDRSSSMKLPHDDSVTADPDYMDNPPNSDSRWWALDDSVSDFLNILNTTAASEQTALVTFASDYTDEWGTYQNVTVDQGLTLDSTLIDMAVTNRTNTIWNGNTEIHSGITEAINVLTGPDARSYADKVIIVFTDGNYTGLNPVSAAAAAESNGCIVHAITFGDGADTTTMQAVAAAGNGRYMHADDAAQLTQVFEDIASSLTVFIK